MEESETCRVGNVRSWELLLNLMASEQKGTARNNAPEIDTMHYYLHNPRIRYLLTEWLKKLHSTHARKHSTEDSALKCDEISLLWRQRGNELYTKPNKPVTEAYDCYQWSVLYAKPDGRMMPLALANRSAALARLKKYNECLSDIEWALEVGYPRAQRHKLLLRRADCYAELGLEHEARHWLQEAVAHAANVTLSSVVIADFETTVKQVEHKLRSIRVIGCDAVYLPPLLQGPNDAFVHASSAVKLMRNADEFGRYVATRDQACRGDVLFSEEPYASVALPGVGLICETCCDTQINIVPCNECTRVAFCSLECRDRGEILFHRWECVGFQSELFHTIGIAHLALRVMIMMTNEGFPVPVTPSAAIQKQLIKLAQDQPKPSDTSPLNIPLIKVTKPPDSPKTTNSDLSSDTTDTTFTIETSSCEILEATDTPMAAMPNDESTNDETIDQSDGLNTTIQSNTIEQTNSSPTNSKAFNRIESIVQPPSSYDQGPDTNEKYSASALRALENRAKGLDENGFKLKPKVMKVQAAELFASYKLVDNVNIYRPEYPPMYRMFHLVCNFSKMSNDDFAQYCSTAATLTQYLDQYTSFFDYLPHQLPFALTERQLREFTAAILLRAIGQLICNGHAALSLVTDKTRDREVRRATAIYPSTAMMNHSCDPDVINNFYKTRLIIRCARELPAGTMVSNCYGPHYARMTHTARRNILRTQYGFYCHCDACCDKERKDFAKLFSAYACLYCKAPLASSKRHCTHCKEIVRLEARRDLLESAEEIWAQAQTLENLSAVCEVLQAAMKNLQRALHRHNSNLREHADHLAGLHIECGQFSKAIELIKQNIQSAEYQYGSFSSEVANELRKLSNVMFMRINASGNTDSPNYRDWCLETHKVVRKAVTLMELNYGSWEPLVKRLQEVATLVGEQLAGMRSPEEAHEIAESIHYNMHYNLKI